MFFAFLVIIYTGMKVITRAIGGRRADTGCGLPERISGQPGQTDSPQQRIAKKKNGNEAASFPFFAEEPQKPGQICPGFAEKDASLRMAVHR